jgi:thioredoxin-dependent peroxiredoxin
MATITLEGNQINTVGNLPAIGSAAPDFVLTTGDLADVTLADYSGKKKILNIVPSLDTGICAASTKKFNDELKKLSNTIVLTISADLPFAQGRFCKAEEIDSVVTLSMLRSKDFGTAYGTLISDGPLAGILSRAIVVLDENDKVVYTEQVPEIVQEPDYDKALSAVR